MKLSNLIWEQGKRYYNSHQIWIVDGNELVDTNGIDIHYSCTLKEVSEMEFIEVNESNNQE